MFENDTDKEFNIVKRALENGYALSFIDLLDSKKYLSGMCSCINENTSYNAFYDFQNKIRIETYNSFPVLDLELEKETIKFHPRGEDFFNIFIKVMEYLAKKQIKETKSEPNHGEIDWE